MAVEVEGMNALLIIGVVCLIVWLVGTLTHESLNGLVPIALTLGIVCLVIWAIWGSHWRWGWW